MTDNFEDVEHQETGNPEEQPAGGARSNLAEAWRTKPIFKLVAVMMVVGALIAAASVFFSGGNKAEQVSKLVNPPEIHRAPGGSASPYFIQQTKEAEEQREKQALEKGTSALPTPIGQPGDINVTEKADPMNELRSETEHLKQQLADMQKTQAQRQSQQVAQQVMTQQQAVQQAATAAPPSRPSAPEQFDASLSQAMQGQLKQLMDSWVPKGIKQVEVTKTAASGAGAPANAPSGALGQVADASGVLHHVNEKPLITAGTVSYAQMLTEANSDVPAPILAQIVSGPLSGARAIGSFQIANGYNDYLVLKFSLADKKGKDYRIDAIALDPDTTLAGMETEVDQRYFTRVIMPAAAAFLQGFGQALGQTSSQVATNGTTTIVSQSGPGITQGIADGAASSANTAAQFFQNQANDTKPLVRVAAGTPMGLFFVSSVYENAQDQQEANGGCPQGTVPLAPGAKPPAGALPSTNGCYALPTTTAGAYAPPVAGQPAGYGYGYNSDVPYPNAGQARPTYGSPYGAYSPSSISNSYGRY